MSKFITSDPPYNSGASPINASFLQLAGGVALSTTLTNVTDQLNNPSTLYLSTNQVSIGTTANDNPLALFGTSNLSAIFNTSNIATSNKTFTFPNASLTFAGIDIAQTFSGLNNFTTTQNFNVPDGTSGTSNISIPTIPYSGGGRNANHPTLVLGSVTGSIWGLSGSGTYLGINAPTGFTGNLIDLKLNGTTVLNITQTGALTSTTSGAASTPALSLTGTPFVGTQTTSVPLFYLNGGTSPITWDNTTTGGTYIGINSIANFAGNFIDFRKNGGTSLFKIASTGQVVFGSGGTTSAPAIVLGSTNTGIYGDATNVRVVAAGGIVIGFNSSSETRFFGSPQFSGTNSTGSGTALLGGNSPATTLSAPYTWISAKSSDGSTVYIPCWK